MRAIILSLLMVLGFSATAFAQEDEIIVTGTRVQESPGIFVEKKGDFLLLEVQIINDSRESDIRLKEMKETIDIIIAASKKDEEIILSLIDDNDFVRPLSKQAFIDSIRRGGQPDTSVATLKVKTNIPAEVTDSYKLAQKLNTFVEALEPVGRTKVINYDDVSVSILNPYQFRDEVRNKVIKEMSDTADVFGADYIIIPKGLDGPVRWTRSGDLNLAFYMDYSYKILPKSLSIQVEYPDDFHDED